MKQNLRLIIFMLIAGVAAMPTASRADRAAETLQRFFQASGGLEKLQQLQSVSLNASIDAYGYDYTLNLLADGRFRIEAPDRITVFDGRDYWQSFHGVVHKLAGEELEEYADVSLAEIFLHGFVDANGQAARLEFKGEETTRGQTHNVLAATTPDGRQRTFFLNAATGLLDKMVELVPDPDLRERKNIFTYAEYQDVGGLVLPTRAHGICITNSEEIQPDTKLSDFKLNEPVDESVFARPTSAVPAVTLQDGALLGVVVAFSGGGSLITSITAEDLAQLEVEDGMHLVAEVRGRRTTLEFGASLEAFEVVRPEDYLASFNNTPALWLVKAYVGMRNDDPEYAVGDHVRLTVATETEGR